MYMDKGWLLGASGNDTTLGMYIYGAKGPRPSTLGKSEDIVYQRDLVVAGCSALVFTFETEC